MRISGTSSSSILLACAGILILLGILMIINTSAHIALDRFDTPYFYFWRQILFGIIPGVILGIIAFKIPLEWFRKWSPVLFVISIGLIALVLFPVFGLQLGGATRWISLGPISFQPSELLKVAFILYFASVLAKYHALKKLNVSSRAQKLPKKPSAMEIGRHLFERLEFKPLLIAGVIIGFVAGLLAAQPDMSTLGVIALSGMVMYFVSGTPWWHTLLFLGGGGGVLYLATKFHAYIASRILVFLHPETDPLGIGYQINQAVISVGSGGLFGVGLGMSGQKFGFIPEPMGDSVFTIFAEETGFFGSMFLFAIYFLLFWQIIRIVMGTKDLFCQLVAIGIGCWILFQTFVNIGAMTGLVPVTGIPLPFISYGGSHLVAELIALGILLNIATNRSARKRISPS